MARVAHCVIEIARHEKLFVVRSDILHDLGRGELARDGALMIGVNVVNVKGLGNITMLEQCLDVFARTVALVAAVVARAEHAR